MDKTIQAGKFKAECLKIMDEVQNSGRSIVITKRRVPIARLCPIKKKHRSLFGIMRGMIHIQGDLIEPIGEDWDANS